MQKALIVDDSRTAQIKLQKMLRPYPLEIVTADSAEEALCYLENQNPAVIFMDHSMPGMDGLEALKIIRSNPKTATMPVIMYTAQQGDVYVGRAQAAGANDVLSKDVMDELGLKQVLSFLRLTPLEKPARVQNVTSISRRLTGQNSEDDHSKAIAQALSGRTSSVRAADIDKESMAGAATPSKPDKNETTSETSSGEKNAKVANSSQGGLPDDARRISGQAEEKEPSQHLPNSQRYRAADGDSAKPAWPSLLVIALLLFVAFQLVEIRNDQSELDRMVREIRIQMETD